MNGDIKGLKLTLNSIHYVNLTTCITAVLLKMSKPEVTKVSIYSSDGCELGNMSLRCIVL